MTGKNIACIALSLGFAACASHETELALPEDAISVESPFIYRGTRASGDIDNQSITDHEFKVWGHTQASTADVFDGTSFAWAGTGWTYSPVQKWDGRTITFAALAPTESGGITSVYAYDPATKCFKIENIPPYQEISNGSAKSGIDYLVAEALINRTQEDGDLQFSFHHILSKLQVFVRYQSPEPLESVTITKMEISLPTGSAKYQQVDPVPSANDVWEWSMQDTTYVDFINETAFSVPSEATALPKSFFIAPCQNASLKMNLNYVCADANGAEVANQQLTDVPVQGITAFTQGKVVNLYVTINYGELGTISFQPSVSPWEE